MTIYDVQYAVTQVVCTILKKKFTDIDESISLIELGADELDLFEFVLKLEDTFALEISDDDTEKLNTIAQTVSYIWARKSEDQIDSAPCK